MGRSNPDGRSSWLSPFAVVGDPVSPDAQPIPIDVYTGVLELMGENGIAVYAGAGVGGGSLVYRVLRVDVPLASSARG